MRRVFFGFIKKKNKLQAEKTQETIYTFLQNEIVGQA